MAVPGEVHPTKAEAETYFSQNPPSAAIFTYGRLGPGSVAGAIYSYDAKDDTYIPIHRIVAYTQQVSPDIARKLFKPDFLARTKEELNLQLITLKLDALHIHQSLTRVVGATIRNDAVPNFNTEMNIRKNWIPTWATYPQVLDFISQNNIYTKRPGANVWSIISGEITNIQYSLNLATSYARLWAECWIAGYDVPFREIGDSQPLKEQINPEMLQTMSSFSDAELYTQSGVNLVTGQDLSQWRGDIKFMANLLKNHFKGAQRLG